MAAAPLETLSTGAVAALIFCGDCQIPHERVGLEAPHFSPACRVVGRCSWVGHAALSAEERRESMPRCMLHEALRAGPRGLTVNDLRLALRVASAQTGVHGG